MNTDAPTLAKLIYKPNDFEIVEFGDYVLCGVTGDAIPLDALRYWDVETQMAFKDVEVANRALAPDIAP